MPCNDFRALSSQDFEELVRDLLQAEWDVHLEAFKSGRDKGIDLRYATTPGTKTIVQCKHYVGSGFAKLLAHLRNLELPKVKRLRPRRYVVATSLQLNPDEKDALVAALRPFVQNSQDIYGGNDLDGLLARHHEVRRAHFKLWLTNTDVIGRVLHNAEQSHTDFEVRRILQKLPLFVQSAAFPRAMEMLQREKVLVISGVPGIGKTTLAEMLIYAHINEGYLPAAIQAEITEGRRLFRDDPNAKQVFFYDDFLGQTFLGDRAEYLGRNQDAALIDFMEMVRRSPQSRFILTTREHILRSALQVSERLSRSSSLEERCILELNDYTRGDKARILYNHIYFSDLPQAYKEALLEDDFFLK
jgi:hypothetical protein